MTDHAIATRGLVKRYGQQEAVNGLEMRVPAGAVYGCLGRNGAGKSTTIKMLMGLARPDSGSASVLGFDCATQTVDILRRVAFVGENKTLYGELTPEEMVRFTRGFYPRWSASAAEAGARRLEVPMRRSFKTLSKGNRAKVWLLTDVTPLSLRDVFLELVRKEDPCTSGNAGATLAAPSLAS